MFLIYFSEVMHLKKHSKKIILFVIPFVVVGIISFLRHTTKEEHTAIEPDFESISAYTESFGWQISEESLTFSQITIPYRFNDVYTQYNKVQKKQGFDLAKYKGKTVTLITATVTNFTDGEPVYIELITDKTLLIGANLKSYGNNGFIKPLNINEL